MKGFLITVFALLGLGIYVTTRFGVIGGELLLKIQAEEGTLEAVQEAAAKDPVAFGAKYQPLLERRWTLAKIAKFLDDDFFLSLTGDCVLRYDGTGLDLKPPFDKILLERAQMLEAKVKPPVEAFALFKRHLETFPGSKDANIAQGALNRLAIKYGMQ